jgi:VanZ family protein
MKEFTMNHVMKYWLPVLLWAGMIFYSSSQPYEKQDMRPGIMERIDPEQVERWFSSVKFSYANYEISVQNMGAAGFLEFFVRKGAHLTVFFGLGILLFRAFSQYRLPVHLTFMYAFTLLVTYAALDEVHQGFTDGRTPLWQDALLDSVGGFLGIVVWLYVQKRKKSVASTK